MGELKVIHVSAWGRMFTQFRMPMLRELRERLARQTIYCPNEIVHVNKLLEEGFEVVIGEVSPTFRIDVINQIKKLYQFIQKEKFSVLIAHQPMGALVGIPAAYLAGVPLKIYSSGGLKFNTDYKGLLNILFKYGELKIIEMSDAVFLVNKEDEQVLKRIPCVMKKAYYIGPKGGCGVDTNRFNPQNRLKQRGQARKELGMEDDIFVVGYVGRCVWEKGFKEIVDSAYDLEYKSNLETRFLILGEGQHLSHIEEYARNKGIANRFIFLGYKFDVDYYMSAFDLFILPSYREGLPVSLLEAMALGIPCIATNIRGNRDLIQDQQNGLLIPTKTTDKLVEAILFMKNNPQKRAKIGNMASETVSKKYDEPHLVENMVDIIFNLFKNTNRHNKVN